MFVVTHLSQELKFQLTQDLPDTKRCYFTLSVSSYTLYFILNKVFFYLAVSSSDHVYVVANQLECEASVHESKAALQRERQTEIRPNIS